MNVTFLSILSQDFYDYDTYLATMLLLFSDHEMAIMQRLQDVILERADLIHDVVETSAELDWFVFIA